MEELGSRKFKDMIYTEIARMGKAMADPKRLEILDLLLQAEKNVELLANETGMSMASTSHHLQILKEAKLVADRRAGKFIYYSIREAGVISWRTISRLAEENIAEVKKLMNDFFKSEDEVNAIDYAEFMRQVMKDQIVLLDVRPANEYEADHIPGSISMPLKDLADEIRKLSKKHGGLRSGGNYAGDFPRSNVANSQTSRKKIVAYCRGRYCVLSHEAVEILKAKGFKAYRLPDSVADFRDKSVSLSRKRKKYETGFCNIF